MNAVTRTFCAATRHFHPSPILLCRMMPRPHNLTNEAASPLHPRRAQRRSFGAEPFPFNETIFRLPDLKDFSFDTRYALAQITEPEEEKITPYVMYVLGKTTSLNYEESMRIAKLLVPQLILLIIDPASCKK